MYIKSTLAAMILFLNPGCIPTNQKPLIHRLYSPHISKGPSSSTCIDGIGNSIQPLPITIWVHGTRFLPKGVLENFFYSKPGLNHYTSIAGNFQQRKIAQTLINSDSKLFAPEHFYLFGWNGKLSFNEREKAARTLYRDLKEVRKNYKKTYGIEPIIRMVSHSHGGNIILLLEHVKDPTDKEFFIHAAVLMATPVQKQTMNYAHADTFGKVYSLYSILDVVQILDPQGWQQETDKFFSERYFPTHEKIEQVSIKKNNRSIMHLEFVQLKFLAKLPQLLSEIDRWRAQSTLSAADWAIKDKCICIDTKRKLA